MIQIGQPIETAELVAFVRTVDAKSVLRAAAELAVPRATLSRRLARLEARLGTRLLRRTTRRLALTDTGETFYRHACIALDAVNNAAASIAREAGAVAGDLRVSVPPLLGDGLFGMLASFAKTHQSVRLQVDFSSRFVDLVRDGYDVAIRAGRELEPGLVARTLIRTDVIAVASPAYLAEHGTPRRRAELKRHRCLMGFARGELPESHWRSGATKIKVDGAFFSNEPRLLVDAAVHGLGIAFLPRRVVATELAGGALEQVLAGVVESENTISVVYAEREFLAPQVRAFVDAVTAWSAALGAQAPTRGRPSPSKRTRKKR